MVNIIKDLAWFCCRIITVIRFSIGREALAVIRGLFMGVGNMRIRSGLCAGLGFALLAGQVLASDGQDCIIEGTVKSRSDVANGTNVYIAFYSAEDAAGPDSCKLNRRGKLAFKEPKNAMIENVPAGSKVRYHYKQQGSDNAEWQLMDVSY